MNLFENSDVDLPSAAPQNGRKSAHLQRVPLFAKKVLDKAIGLAAIDPTPAQKIIAKNYAKKVRSAGFQKLKETEARPVFQDEILKDILGYTQYSTESEYSLVSEKMLRRKPVDFALGRFYPESENDLVLAPFEMKGPGLADLDRIMSGRGLSPVQQAWDYAADAPGAKWVLVSNCLEIRLYGFGRGRDAYEVFDLAALDEPGKLERLLLLLSANRFIGGETEALLKQSDLALKDVTDELYADYKLLRETLMGFLVNAGEGPKMRRRAAVEVAQKLLDRMLFIAFAGSNHLLPANLLQRAAKSHNEFNPAPVWTNFKTLFRAVDIGNAKLDIWAYNGGLFAEDKVADDLMLPDHLAQQMARLGEWDYGSEVPVTVLGHIFEQSIGDIEKLREEAPQEVAGASKSKREGVVYTPDHITRFLVDLTINKTLSERFDALLLKHTGISTLPDKEEVPWKDEQTEINFWQEYLAVLRDLTIVDPACGSGAFLVQAFDTLVGEYRRVRERLLDFDVETGFDIYDEILTKNLYGVDLNVESAEITRLSLWLKTARRDYRLQSLEQTIQAGNSIIHDKSASDRPFNWKKAFPEVFKRGGFDVVIGNPPYVRMEFLKPVKPWLSKNYKVADERTDLSAYFFEKGVDILKKGGRLGYISTSSFFRAGYGEKLRLLLGERTDIETVIDFGDVQIFEGVTTYPAILIAKRKEETALPEGELQFLNIKDALPENLGRTFDENSQPMPRARLTGGSWQFEDDALARLREKIVAGKKTLGEVYGAPLYGIKTGLNEAFIIDTETRDRLVKADPKSVELLKPFLKGENIKRWRVEPDGLWLINTPKGKVDIDKYPAIRDWLFPFKDRLEKRATTQEWWELQQAQLAYQPKFEEVKIVYPVISQGRKFAFDEGNSYINDKCFMIEASYELLTYLNSKLHWFWIFGEGTALRGGMWRIELREQLISRVPLPNFCDESPYSQFEISKEISQLWATSCDLRYSFHHRLLTDLAAPGAKLSKKLREFHLLDTPQFHAELKKSLKAVIALKERGEWEEYHRETSDEINRLTDEIEAAEREIDVIVYEAFDLTPDEIALLEKSLEGQV